MKETVFEFEREPLEVQKARFEEAAYLLKSLAHETRIRAVLELAKGKEMTVTELQVSTGCEQSLLSHHLTDMRSKGILNCRRSGKNNFYSIKEVRVIDLLKCVLSCGSAN